MIRPHILQHPSKLLRKRSREVKDWDTDLLALIGDLAETAASAGGSGLAAVQVGVPLRVLAIRCNDGGFISLVNPRIVKSSGRVSALESCLSVPTGQHRCERHARITVEHSKRSGVQTLEVGDPELAVAIQHELDHMNGVLIVDRGIRVAKAS